MAEDSRITTFLTRNKIFAQNYKPMPLISQLIEQARANPPAHPAMAIISCMDPRVSREAFFGLQPMEATVITNAGGRAADAMRSVYLLDALNPIGTVVVVHHTDCGMTYVSAEGLSKRLEDKVPEKKGEIEGMEWGEFTDLEQSVRDDVEIVKSSPYLSKDLKVLGFVYDIAHGTVEEVKA